MKRTKFRLSRKEQIVGLKKMEKLNIDNIFRIFQTKERLDICLYC